MSQYKEDCFTPSDVSREIFHAFIYLFHFYVHMLSSPSS